MESKYIHVEEAITMERKRLLEAKYVTAICNGGIVMSGMGGTGLPGFHVVFEVAEQIVEQGILS
ncbi:hypothetical protein [Paraburkholderia humisilvae]|uniref:Uncharacterized protein n=1 Tax=Paraburkholderia humisilvae TaxID=627669 RepID=A0A6J5F9D0_9BURK|nr:hypothetical protein [Paraburkholderia humisilvae]CAB3774391.1 hypothetical protein LMG29542_07773 [Paraburkholderia humisilvae]